MRSVKAYTFLDVYSLRNKAASAKKTFSFCEQLSSTYNVQLVCIVGPSSDEKEYKVNDSFSIVTVKSRALALFGYLDRYRILPFFYLYFFYYFFNSLLLRYTDSDDIVIFENLFLSSISRRLSGNSFQIYSSHNVESHWYNKRLDRFKILKGIHLRTLKWIEQSACNTSKLITTLSQHDLESFASEYDLSSKKIVYLPLLPNLVEPRQNASMAMYEYYKLNHEYKIILFCGSNTYTNTKSVDFIINDVVPFLDSGLHVVFVGSVCRYVTDVYGASDDYSVLGFVADLQEVLRVSDLAINPVFHPFGVNIKMYDYVEAQLPIVSTLIGLRGFEYLSDLLIASEPHEFAATINSFFNGNSSRAIDYNEYLKGYDMVSLFTQAVDSL